MATYKVIQDIEAEDKLFGPLTLKQFIFACLVILFGYLVFWTLINGLWVLSIIFFAPTLFFGILAFPYGKDQPTEVWLMAKLRFFFRPRRRIWDQDGMKELVTITVPKHEEKHYTDGLSNTEVRSRLKALADTIDSRGWAIKGASVNIGAPGANIAQPSDRLYQPVLAIQDAIAPDIKASDDIYDEASSPTAQNFTQMIQQSEKKHRNQITSQLSQSANQQSNQEPQITQQNDYWFMRQSAAPNTPNVARFGATPIVNPGQQSTQTINDLPADEEKKILDKIHKNKDKPNPMNSHLKKILPLSDQEKQTAQTTLKNNINQSPEATNKQAPTTDKSPGQEPANAGILNFANNNDLSVETIARQANKNKGKDVDNEVVVSLH